MNKQQLKWLKQAGLSMLSVRDLNQLIEQTEKGEELEKEKDYWKEHAELRLKIILDLEKQLRENGKEPYSETRKRINGIG